MYRPPDDALFDFYRPFYESGSGQILVLAAPQNHIRDGLAALELARPFPVPQCRTIAIEPSRPTVPPARNIILVGRNTLFIEKNPRGVHGTPPLGVGYANLGDRLERITSHCCYSFEGGATPRILNGLTQVGYEPQERNRFNKRIDFGVIRRVFRGASENTILVEGTHGLGTLGAAMVATSPDHLREIRAALSQIVQRDSSKPVEILVRVTFNPSMSQDVFVPAAIEARPLNIIYDRVWSYDMEAGDRRWVNQEPYDLEVEAWGDEDPLTGPGGGRFHPVPCLEMEADLRRFSRKTREICRRLLRSRYGSFPAPPVEGPDADHLLARLTDASDQFGMTLLEDTSWGIKQTPLPVSHSTIRLLRKRFLIHVVMCHFLGRRLLCREENIRRYFPELLTRAAPKGQDVTGLLTGAINGRMREGFLPLFGEKRKPTRYMKILMNRAEKSYHLRLERLGIVLKLRL
ncbi:MAG: hypothetical protein ACE5HU_09750 [Acidobacteriota bacterium]